MMKIIIMALGQIIIITIHGPIIIIILGPIIMMLLLIKVEIMKIMDGDQWIAVKEVEVKIRMIAQEDGEII